MILNYTMLCRIKKGLVVLFVLLSRYSVAQNVAATPPMDIGVIARPSTDSIALRWAPVNVDTWLLANQYGYTVERFTLVRKGKLLQSHERKRLTSVPVKPLEEAAWEKFTNNKYGMIAAQALYGETFQLDVANSNVMDIVNKAREDEQRFSIALFCADMSPTVAKAMGLYLNDRSIEREVKYLYRISVITPTDTITGSAFVDTAERYKLPSVKDLAAETSGKVVTLQWSQLLLSDYYTSYVLERSGNGDAFAPISDLPGVTLSKKGREGKFQYALDTLPALQVNYQYRVRGVTPFGEYGPFSNVVNVTGVKTTSSSVIITSAISPDNRSVDIQWEFPVAENDALTGFDVTRSPTSSGPYKAIHNDPLPATARTFKDVKPLQSNYYKVKAKTLSGKEIISMPYLALLVDSIPPGIPIGLSGKVDEFGNVRVYWKKNKDADILGYRVYRAYYSTEEFSLLTPEPIADTTFADNVQLKTLNEKIHYQVMAIDRSQNHSALSLTLSLALPDKLPPMPPVWLPSKSTKDGVVLRWQPSGSVDVVRYDVYKKGDQQQWIRLTSQAATADSLYTYTDDNLRDNRTHHYTVVAVDEAGLESPPTSVATGFKLPVPLQAIEMNVPTVDRENKRITITWQQSSPPATSFRVYKKTNDGPMQLYTTVKETDFIDTALIPGDRCTYQVVAVFENGALSQFGKMVEVQF
ncbi:fibronectin type III domain-containing protein [Chryseolinea lacunae]|uniref:Fibronectin type-III domain-containing protein n=1 Tax=Chryseolinea lacunae TaxID=2801331 RepID=A0ABS1KK01_9BACT|nr:hypothetical protein [Chryseolinea lacunae]MBL0739669.1 hypothetical protein [Chryseolinea lacunae]